MARSQHDSLQSKHSVLMLVVHKLVYLALPNITYKGHVTGSLEVKMACCVKTDFIFF